MVRNEFDKREQSPIQKENELCFLLLQLLENLFIEHNFINNYLNLNLFLLKAYIKL
jgi:hypothetical protein